MGSPSGFRKGGTAWRRANLGGRCRAGESRQSVGAGGLVPPYYSPLPLLGLLRNVCLGKEASGKMGRGTYHYSGPAHGQGVGGAKEEKKT